MGPKPPSDLDFVARRKWRELVDSVDPDTDAELLANFCRQHSNLIAIRGEKAKQIKSGHFEVMIRGRDGSMILNPLLTAENRLVTNLNRMLKTLGMSPGRDEQERRKSKQTHEDVDALELKLCGPNLEPSAAQLEVDRRGKVNEALLAQGDWRNYEKNYDRGR